MVMLITTFVCDDLVEDDDSNGADVTDCVDLGTLRCCVVARCSEKVGAKHQGCS